MADDRTNEQASTGAAIKRRGILAAAGAVVAGIVAKQVSQPVAADGVNVQTGGSYTESGSISITSTGATALALVGGAGHYGLTSTCNSQFGVGVHGDTDIGVGVDGYASLTGQSGGTGVRGQANNPSGIGVRGIAIDALGVGVRGESIAYYGVYGTTSVSGGGSGVVGATNGFPTESETIRAGSAGLSHVASVPGVYGHATVGNTAGIYGSGANGGAGVFGINSNAAGIGVQGFNDFGPAVQGNTSVGTGVRGLAAGGNGVYGLATAAGTTQIVAGVFGDSTASYGILGRTTAVNYSGCTGIADGANRAAFAGAGTNGAWGAYFTGPTVVSGNFTVINGAKNAAVKHTDGSYRLLHCVESPEPWFEDFGEAKLLNGRAEVKFDADFAAVVDTSSYHVFLAPRGDCNGLYTGAHGAGGFTVQERNKGANSLTFSYRIVARRKDLGKVERLARFELPKIKLPKPEDMPPPPAPPKKP